MSILLTLINSFAILLIAFFFYKKYGTDYPKLYWISLILKVGGGCALGLVYLYYYSTSDTWTFFNEARLQANLAITNAGDYFHYLISNRYSDNVSHPFYLGDRNSILIKFISLLCLISGNNYWICAAYFSIISFACAWYLFVQIVNFSPSASLATAMPLFFFPSIIFWGSGVIKETFALAGIFLITSIFIRYVFNASIKWNHMMVGIVSLIVVWMLKYYWLAIYLGVFIPTAFTLFLYKKKRYTNSKLILIWINTLIVAGILITLIHPNFYLSRIFEVIVSNNESFLVASGAKNVINFYQLQPTWWSIALNSPWAVLSGLFRPFVWEASNLPAALASLENLILLALTISAVLNFKNYQHKESFMILLIYCVILCTFLALSTPNLGTLSRYRIGFSPFYIFAIVYQNPVIKYFAKQFRFFKE